MVHTPRLEERVYKLDTCFNLSLIERVWQKYVKTGLRSQGLLDLHDYYDFHRNRKALANIIRNQILEGKYRPKSPNIIRVEKKYGVCRHLQIPTPEDAVVLQALVETLAPIIKANQPTERAYYSRSHSAFIGEESVDGSFPYPWFKLWPQFQEKIYKFTTTFKYVVVTDIANYYDNISFDRLRNVISSYGKFEEVLLDFLFFMLESFVWRPDYLPLSGVGLPQVNFDAPRLLGHAFLFEIDRYLNDKTNGNFVRWMDDIDFGTNDTDTAKKILRDLDELLLTRGLRLNMGKTKILSSSEARHYFLPDENRYLSVMTERINRKLGNGLTVDDEKKLIRKRFNKFLKRPRIGRWEKVYNRYFSIAGKTRDRYLEKFVPELLSDSPAMRESIFRYYLMLGCNLARFNQLKDFFESEHCADDTSIFSVAKVFVDWPIPPYSQIRKEIVLLAKRTANNTSANLVASIWMLAKYTSSSDLASFLGQHSNRWKYSSFLSRQVAATTPRIRKLKGQFRFVEKTLSEAGQLDALRVMYHLDEFRQVQPLKSPDKMYIMHGKGTVETYPLYKYLILLDLLTCENVNPKLRQDLRKEVLPRIPDPLYLKEFNSLII